MMKQEEIDKLMLKIDKKCKFPKYWENFINENSKTHHLIIKDKKMKKLYCTNCHKYFSDTTIKVRDYVECPNCHQVSCVYGINYYRHSFAQSVVLVQRMDKKVIIRIFEIYSYFEEGNKKIKKSCIEYARIIPGIGRFLGNNVYINMFGLLRVYHGYKKINWSKYKGYKYFTDHPTYPYNKKRIIKGTNMEYAPIKEFMNKFSYYRYNFLDVLELAAYGSFELLWNMKLYNLCFYSKALNKNGSFYKRFGVPKSFLKFMQDNNVTYKELMILRLFQRADSELFQKFKYCNLNHLRYLIKNNILDDFSNSNLELNASNIKLLKEISEFVPLKKLMKYYKGLNNLIIYRDYLIMSKKLALNYKSKKDLFPRNLISRHDKMQKKLTIEEDRETHFAAYLRYLELSKYTYEDNKYIIFPAPSIDDLKKEGLQQGNCVGSMYLQPYINSQTEIFFMRDIEKVDKSLITLEFKNGHIVQKELPHHSQKFTEEQNTFINNWVNFRQFMDQKEKYKKKQEIKVIKYNFKNMAA